MKKIFTYIYSAKEKGYEPNFLEEVNTSNNRIKSLDK